MPVKVSGITEAVAVSAGFKYSIALLKNGTVMAWGENERGQLGNGTTTGSDVPVAVSNLSEVVSVAAGTKHVLALLKTGAVRSWGSDLTGQLGDDTCCDHSDTPVAVSNITEATAIWGENRWGQLGDDSSTGPEICEKKPCSKIPVAVSGLTEATSIAGDSKYALAVGAPPHYSQSIDSGHSLNAVSCVPGTTDCIASDSAGKAFYATNVTAYGAATWNSWTGPGTSPSEAVDCPTTSLCLLADGADSGNGGNMYYATSLGGAWTEAYSPSYGVDAISCVSSTFCVDGQDNEGYFRYSTSPASTKWELEDQGTATMSGVNCLSTSFCAIVDSAGDVHVANTTHQIESSAWTSTNVDSTPLHGIACTSTTSCVAIDGAGNVLNLAVSSKSEEAKATATKDDIDGTNDLTAITCTTSTICAAVDTHGNVFVSNNNGTNWVKEYALGDDLTSVSCSSGTLCAATDTTGNIVTFEPR